MSCLISDPGAYSCLKQFKQNPSFVQMPHFKHSAASLDIIVKESKPLSWIELGWVEVGWIQAESRLNLSWIELCQVELGWINLGLIVLDWFKLGWIDYYWI